MLYSGRYGDLLYSTNYFFELEKKLGFNREKDLDIETQ